METPASRAPGTDLTGTWVASIKLNFGGGNATFTFKHMGENLSGTYRGVLGDSKVDGTVRGDSVEWHFSHARLGKIQFTGMLTGGSRVEGKAQYGEHVRGTFVAERKS
jgi:hypothetical protein